MEALFDTSECGTCSKFRWNLDSFLKYSLFSTNGGKIWGAAIVDFLILKISKEF